MGRSKQGSVSASRKNSKAKSPVSSRKNSIEPVRKMSIDKPAKQPIKYVVSK